MIEKKYVFFLYFLMSVQSPGYLLTWDEKKATYDVAGILVSFD